MIFSRKISRTRLDALLAAHKSDELILDLGSGRSPYKHLFPNTVSVDIHLDSGADIIADATKLPLENGRFNKVLCLELLEHISEPKKCIDEIFRVLRPGGTLMLSTRFLFSIHHAPNDYYRFTRYGLLHLLERFEIISIEAETVNFETLGVLLQRLVFQTDLRLSFFFTPLFSLLAHIVGIFNSLILKQYGRRNRTMEEKEVLASGYLVVCRKPDQ